MLYFFSNIGILLPLFPFIWPNYIWYHWTGLENEYSIGGSFMIDSLYSIGTVGDELIKAMLSSLSGGYWMFLNSTTLISFILFCLGFLIISVIGDSLIQIYIVKKNAKYHQKKSNTIYIWLYSLYRILFPDFFIIGALITYLTGVQMKKDEIWKLNLRIQLIRVLIGILFFCVIAYFR